MIINKTVQINENFSSNNYQFNKKDAIITIPHSTIIEKDIQSNGYSLDCLEPGGKASIKNLKTLQFADNAIIENLPKYETKYEKNNYSYDFNTGNLTINSIEAKTITINGEKVTAAKDTAAFNKIQIGNIILSDDGGNLKITSVDASADIS